MEIRPRVQPDVTVKFGSVLVGLMGKNRLGKQNKALLLMRSPGSQVNQSSPDSLHSSTRNLGCFPLFFFFLCFIVQEKLGGRLGHPARRLA